MIFLEHSLPDTAASARNARSTSSSPGAIALFGAGLIGSAIRASIAAAQRYNMEELATPWQEPRALGEHIESVGARLVRAASAHPGAVRNVAVIWSAGRAGFVATEEETRPELASFDRVLRMAETVARSTNSRVAFHLISSAGGLFEGSRLVEATTQPRPRRPYGRLKLAQEKRVEAANEQLRRVVYRPSSIYGSIESGHRMGLIPTLVVHGALNRVTRITGDLTTLRDYVWVGDVGAHVAHNVLEGGTVNVASIDRQLLVSGKPTSIAEVRSVIERVLHNRRLLLAPQPACENAEHITFAPSATPPGWRVTAMETSCRALYQEWLENPHRDE